MKNCKSCGKELDKSAKICPNCGKDQRNWFMKHKVLTGFLVLILITVMGGTSETEEVSSTSNANTEKQTEKQEEKIILKVNSVTDWNDPQGFDTPNSGNKFVDVNFDITNNSVEEGIGMNPYNFIAETETVEVESDIVGLDTRPDSDTKIKIGVTKTYDLVFEIGQEDSIIELKYDYRSNSVSTEVTY